MATQIEYTIAANAILTQLDIYVNEYVPDFMGYREKAIAAMPAVAGACAKEAVDALDAARTNTPPASKEGS